MMRFICVCSVLIAAGASFAVPTPLEVNASDFGFLPTASAEANARALQRALDGGRRIVRVTTAGNYLIDRTVFMDSDTELVFSRGAVLKKAKPFCVALANRAAYFGGCDSNITVRGLSVCVNGMEHEADPNGPAPGLQGHVSFFRVKDLRIFDFTCTDFLQAQYCLQVVAFERFLIDGFDIRGGKDGIHLNSGRGFTIRNGQLCTGDDGIAINAGEWPDFTPEMGSLNDGLIENIHDLPGGKCNFARVITGAWVQWHPGIRLQRNDLCNVGNNVYGVTPMPLGTNEYVSLTMPTHTHGVWKSPEGINFLFLQSNGVSRVDIRNVLFRNIRMDCARGISCSWETYEWARLIHPELRREDYPSIDIRLENVVKTAPGPIVTGNADAKIDFVDCRSEKGGLLTMWWSRGRTHCPVRDVRVNNGETIHNDTGSMTVK